MTIDEKEKKKAYNKKYRSEHSEYIKNKKKIYNTENAEFIRAKAKQYRERNSEKIKNSRKEKVKEYAEYSKKYREVNAEILKTKAKNRRDKNIEIYRLYQREYRKTRRKIDPIFKMSCNIQRRIQKMLKVQGTQKNIRTKELFGADQEFVWKHLESQFREGMTRENNTSKGWHVDHIKPMSSFDLSDPEQLKECCHYTNLQPLWWWENLEKSDKLDYVDKNDK